MNISLDGFVKIKDKAAEIRISCGKYFIGKDIILSNLINNNRLLLALTAHGDIVEAGVCSAIFAGGFVRSIWDNYLPSSLKVLSEFPVSYWQKITGNDNYVIYSDAVDKVEAIRNLQTGDSNYQFMTHFHYRDVEYCLMSDPHMNFTRDAIKARIEAFEEYWVADVSTFSGSAAAYIAEHNQASSSVLMISPMEEVD